MEESKIKHLKSLGFNVFPLQPKTKKPIAGLNWIQFQSQKYDGLFPDSCNTAVICGNTSDNLFVVDLDDDSIYDELPQWMKNTYTIQTGKGKHLYYHYNGLPPANKKLDDHRFRHIDIKSEGGYVLAEGSYYYPTDKERREHKYPKENENGFYYKMYNDARIQTIDIPKLKETLKDLGFNVETQSMEELMKGVSEGGRDDTTFKLACYWARQGLFGEALRYEVEKLNERHKPPLPKSDIDRILKQAQKYEHKHIEKHIQEAKKIQEDLSETDPIEIRMQEIDPKKHEDILIKFDCMITSVGDRLTYTKWANANCPICGNGGTYYCDDYYRFVLPKCKKDGVKYVIDRKETAYIQQLIIEEFLEESKNSSPIHFDAEITDENVGEAFMGDRKTITAKFRSVPDNKGRNIPVFDIVEMKDLEQKSGCMPDSEEIEKWKNCEKFFERVTASILPDVMIDPLMVQSTILWGVGGTGLNGKRQLIHEAIIGDAQQGKSELGDRMHKLLPGSGRTVGGKTSGAGLTIGMVKTHNGMMIPRAGFFPQYTNHNCIIDEADKMTQIDQDSCLEVMEQETSTLTKAGVPSMTLSSSCPLLLLGNPKGGKFNSKYPTIMDNFNMQVPFISRFDLIWCVRDKNDPELDKAIRKFIRTFSKRKDQYMTVDELQRYFTYAQSLKATIPEELMDRIDELHAKMRPLNTEKGLPIGWRQYYGIYRLVTASAKAHLREEATIEDFELVEKIIKTSLKTMGMNMDTGEVEEEILPQRETKDSTILETISECMDNDTGLFDKDDFISKLGSKNGFNHLTSPREFTKLLGKGTIELDNDTGFYRRVI